MSVAKNKLWTRREPCAVSTPYYILNQDVKSRYYAGMPAAWFTNQLNKLNQPINLYSLTFSLSSAFEGSRVLIFFAEFLLSGNSLMPVRPYRLNPRWCIKQAGWSRLRRKLRITRILHLAVQKVFPKLISFPDRCGHCRNYTCSYQISGKSYRSFKEMKQTCRPNQFGLFNIAA